MTPSTASADPVVNRFPYGWRYIKVHRPDGSYDRMEEVPLTLEDVLHPQEEDVIPQSLLHVTECAHLANVFRTRSIRPPLALVTADQIVDWGILGIRNHSPDIGVFAGLRELPEITFATLRLKDLGGHCLLVIENVSPSTRENDVVHKFSHYHQIGVPLYVLIDRDGEGAPRALRAYRHTPARYEEIPLDPEGRVYLSPVNLFLGLRDNRIVCYDPATGAVVEDYEALTQTKDALEQRCLEQEGQIEEVVERSHEAEREARRQAQAREQAEKETVRQAQAREQAEKEALRQTQAREEADRNLQEQKLAREKAEERIRQLEEALRQLQSGQGG